MLTIDAFTKKFGDKVAVDDVSLSVEKGEIFALIGPNSSGKTTIVKTIAGLLQKSKGTVTVGGDDVALFPEKTKSRIGYIPDEPTVWPLVSGEEFLHYVGALYGMSPAERAERIKALLPLFALSGMEKDYFEHYSRGNKQKFSILSALMHEPELLLIDEPIVGLDPDSADIARREFVRFAEAGGAVLLVTHTLSVAEAIATHIGILQNGKLVAVGTLSELRAKAGKGPQSSLEDVFAALTHKEAPLP